MNSLRPILLALAVTESDIVSAVALAEDDANWGEESGEPLDLDLPDSDEEAFDALWDLGDEAASEDATDDDVMLFAAYHAGTDGLHFAKIAINGLTGVDMGILGNLLTGIEYDGDASKASTALVDITKAAYDVLGSEEGDFDEVE
ncbi:hypothetical protein UFOVP1382_47 [uncultured Caudovirales phage]|uniref:Uncharacterized protein n=1 Tax=uncultured Caudovirales phage TaxID=2100421 RepID=A0A6J5RXG0_9CAUD|nr:hypothetical protein UFOVP1382_47 [uncultured Caudovirales phage]